MTFCSPEAVFFPLFGHEKLTAHSSIGKIRPQKQRGKRQYCNFAACYCGRTPIQPFIVKRHWRHSRNNNTNSVTVKINKQINILSNIFPLVLVFSFYLSRKQKQGSLLTVSCKQGAKHAISSACVASVSRIRYQAFKTKERDAWGMFDHRQDLTWANYYTQTRVTS